MLPSIFGENLFDDFFMDPFNDPLFNSSRNALYGKHSKNMMKTDVRETDGSYEPVSYTHLLFWFLLFVCQRTITKPMQLCAAVTAALFLMGRIFSFRAVLFLWGGVSSAFRLQDA